jgi:hypothetical protein
MRTSQMVVWAIVALVLVSLWFFGPQDSVVFKLLRSLVLIIVGSMAASLCAVQRTK